MLCDIFSSKIFIVSTYRIVVRYIIHNWVIDHGKFTREKGFTIMDAWFYSAARKNGYDNHSSLNILANIYPERPRARELTKRS